MPEYSNTKQANRGQVSTYDIRKENYGERLDVVAKPVDAFVKSGLDGNALGLIEALKMVPGGMKDYVALQESQKTKNAMKAKADFAQGVNDSPGGILNMGLGYDEQWNALDGEAAMAKGVVDAQSKLEANRFFVDDPDGANKRQQVIKEAWDTSMSGKTHPWAAAAAGPQFEALKVFTEKGFKEADWKMKKEKGTANALDLVSSTGAQFLNDAITTRDSTNQPLKFNAMSFRNLVGGIKGTLPGLQGDNANLVDDHEFSRLAIRGMTSFIQNQVIPNKHLSPAEKETVVNDLLASMASPDQNGTNWAAMTHTDKMGNVSYENLSTIEAFRNNSHYQLRSEEERADKQELKAQTAQYQRVMADILRTHDTEELKKFQGVIDFAQAEGAISDEAGHASHLTQMLNSLINSGNPLEDYSKVIEWHGQLLHGQIPEPLKFIEGLAKTGQIGADTARRLGTAVETYEQRQENTRIHNENKAIAAKAAAEYKNEKAEKQADMRYTNELGKWFRDPVNKDDVRPGIVAQNYYADLRASGLLPVEAYNKARSVLGDPTGIVNGMPRYNEMFQLRIKVMSGSITGSERDAAVHRLESYRLDYPQFEKQAFLDSQSSGVVPPPITTDQSWRSKNLPVNRGRTAQSDGRNSTASTPATPDRRMKGTTK